MAGPSDKQLRRIKQLFAMMGSNAPGERENAQKLLSELLEKLRLTWNDLPALLATPEKKPAPDTTAPAADDDDEAVRAEMQNRALEVVHYMWRSFIDAKPHEHTALALWTLYTFVPDKFLISPRLALVSPVRGCGKTTVLAMLELLAARPLRVDNVTPAALFRMIHSMRGTMLVDEGDNADLVNNPVFRAVLNSGHRKGGNVIRMVKGDPQKFDTFGPLAIAAIGGASLPLPTLSRSIVIHMQRSDGLGGHRRMEEPTAEADLNAAFQCAHAWARTIELNTEPDLPPALKNRAADNWRPLISIADAFGPQWGQAARDAAVKFMHGYTAEDVGITLLVNIRTLFDTLAVDRFASVDLVRHLLGFEDGAWSEFCGLRGDQHPRRITQGMLAKLLEPFGIYPKTVWPLDRSASRRGYRRAVFEAAWSRYCPTADTPTQPSKVKGLVRHRAGT